VAHLNDGTLRRMVDDPDAVAAPDREHFAGCAECKARFAGMEADAKTATALLATPETSFDANAAYRRMTAQPARPRFGFRLPILRPASRGMVAALGLVVLVAVGVTAAVNVSNIFQPQTVKPVPISVADLESLPDLSTYGDFKWTQQPTPAIGISKADAEKVAGFSAPDASSLPAGVTADQITYAATAEIVGTFTFSAAKAQAAAAAQGKTLLAMPAGMDGTTLTMTIGPAILELYGNVSAPSDGTTTDPTQIKLPQLVIGESKAPSVTSDGVSAQELESYLLAQPGLSPELAADIKALGDPTTTLPIPVPVGYATSSDVTVQGVQGVALGDNTGVGAAVVWIKGGDVFFVGGSLKQDDALAVANHLS
jgi:hypothetical protein